MASDLSEMEADGGLSELNQGGAARGTGYCDAQCYTTPFVNGVVSYWLSLLPVSVTHVCRSGAVTNETPT